MTIVEEDSTFVTKADVHDIVGMAADIIRSPERANVLKSHMAYLAVDTVAVFYADSALRSGQTVENSLALLMDGTPEADTVRADLIDILSAVKMAHMPAAERVREALGIQSDPA